jgi:serine/threonine-protein kinase
LPGGHCAGNCERLRAEGYWLTYTIERELGAGGMATVYLAHDVKHDRRVAVKVLRPELAAVIGGERFLNEIKVTANLQHPHILPLHDSGEADSFLYYVMPFVEGDSLREKLDRETQLSIDESIEITRAVASALDYAHRHHVIHRDIKPENVLLHDGQALVADFGIALAVSQAGGHRLTETGLSIGTPHYMSPEQAMGDRELDARSDVYSLGAMLYEMLVGEPPFTGPTAQAIVAKVLTEKPPLVTAARDTVPPHMASAVSGALAKLPADRFPSAAAFANALTGPGLAPSLPGVAGVLAPERASPERFARWREVAAWCVAVVSVAALLLGRSWTSSDRVAAPVVRATVQLPDEAYLSYLSAELLLSRDGTGLFTSANYRGRQTLLSHEMSSDRFEPVSGTESGQDFFISPDGQWAAFTAGGELKKVSLGGGTPVTLDGESRWGFGTWEPDGTIIYSRSYRSGLWRLTENDGEPTALTVLDSARGELAHWYPQVLPDGEHVLFTAFNTPIDRSTIEIASISSGERRILIHGAVDGRYVRTGHILYARDEVVFAAPFDERSLEVTGSAVPVIDDVAMDHVEGRAVFSVSTDGTLAYVPASIYDSPVELFWVSRRGEETLVIPEPGRYHEPALSPDGSRLALTITGRTGNPDVWILDPQRGTRTRLTSGGGADFGAIWTPDGNRVIYSSEQPVFDLFWRSADGSAPAEPLVQGPFDKRLNSVTLAGDRLMFDHAVLPYSAIWTVRLDGSGDPEPLLTSDAASVFAADLAPSRRWLSYGSDESGQSEVYLVPYPEVSGSRQQVSVGGGMEARWTRGGRELVYRAGDRMMAVSVDPRTGTLGTPDVLFTGPYLYSVRQSRSYDVTPDGERFLMVKRSEEARPRTIVVVTNWFEELNTKVGQ